MEIVEEQIIIGVPPVMRKFGDDQVEPLYRDALRTLAIDLINDQGGGPYVLRSVQWTLTSDPDFLFAMHPHCEECRLGNEEAARHLRANPDQLLAVGDAVYEDHGL